MCDTMVYLATVTVCINTVHSNIVAVSIGCGRKVFLVLLHSWPRRRVRTAARVERTPRHPLLAATIVVGADVRSNRGRRDERRVGDTFAPQRGSRCRRKVEPRCIIYINERREVSTSRATLRCCLASGQTWAPTVCMPRARCHPPKKTTRVLYRPPPARPLPPPDPPFWLPVPLSVAVCRRIGSPKVRSGYFLVITLLADSKTSNQHDIGQF